MSAKRGRPLSEQSQSEVVNHRRELGRRRRQQHYERVRAARNHARPITTAQLEQGEQIINLTPTEEESAATTLLQLGLRVQDMTLPQNAYEAELQQDAIDANEQEDLYEARTNEARQTNDTNSGSALHFAVENITRQTNKNAPDQNRLARYFHSLPARSNVNPISTEQTAQTALEHETPSAQLQPTVEQGNEQTTYFKSVFGDGFGDEQDAQDENDPDQPQTTDPEAEVNFVPSPVLSPFFRGSEDLLGEEQLTGPESSEADGDFEESLHSESFAHDQDEADAHDFVVDKLYDQLVHGFHGCTEEQHRDSHRRHVADAGDNHYGLHEVFNDNTFPSVLELQEMITPERLAREQAPTPEQWKSVFCGVPANGSQQHPMRVCLHKEQVRPTVTDVAYDVDSFLGFASSLGFAKKGLWSQIAPQTRQNITADVHIQERMFVPHDNPERPDHARLAMLQRIPHFMLGRVEGAHDISVYVLFPHLHIGGEQFKSLSREQHSRWVDDIYLPALQQFYRAHYTQHLPSSYRTALNDSKAHSIELRQVQGQGYETQRAIGYHLQPEYLDAVWEEVLRRISTTPGVNDFRDAQIFFSCKGTKLQFKTNDTRLGLGGTLRHFDAYLNDCLNLDFIHTDRLYVDVAKEICCPTRSARGLNLLPNEQPQVYLWRRCCQQKYIQWMYDDKPPPVNGDGQRYYTQNMLEDTGSLTSVTPKTSKHRQGGLVYTQVYNSVKEVYDANKCFLFANDAMEELALDPHLRNASRNILGGGRRDTKTVEYGYLQSKRRARDALRDARGHSFGIREEHRVTWAVVQSLRDRLELDDAPEPVSQLTQCPAYAWAISTEVYFQFLWRSLDKFATGFEVVRARSRPDFTTWEQTKMMAMFLRCLRFVCGGHLLQQEGALWHGRREKVVGDPPRLRLWYGLGFKNTLLTYKYCWLEPRIDWNTLQFDSTVTDNVLFGNKTLQGAYLRRGKQARDFFDVSRQLELALDWIGTHRSNERVCERMVSWMVHICLRQFRIDVMNAVKAEIEVDEQEEALDGEKGFCYEYIDEVMVAGCYLMSGNKTEFKQVNDLARFLFGVEDGLVREHWDDRPFRALYRRAHTGISIRNGAYKRVFPARLRRWLWRYHWVLPYPCNNALLQTTKAGQRMWYSIELGEGNENWQWARKGWKTGKPNDFPRWSRWNKEEWQQWVERQE